MKNTQLKIILIFIVTGLVVCLGFGFVINSQVAMLNSGTISITNFNSNINIVLFLFGIIYSLSLLILLIVLSRIVIVPVNRLIKSAEKIVKTDEAKMEKLKDIKKIPNNKESKISDVFTLITNELNQKISEIETQKNQIEAILQHMTDGVIAFDKEQNILFVNAEAKKLLDISPENENFESIFDKFKKNINFEKIMYLDAWTSMAETVVVNNNYLNIVFVPFKDEEKLTNGVIAVIQNITEQAKLNEMRKEFVADVSHELKTPLTTIMGYSETILTDEYDKETQHRFLKMILSEAQRMARLVTDLLTLSKYDQSTKQATKEEFDLTSLVKSVVDRLQIEAKKKQQELVCYETSKNMPLAYANKDDIERVIINIVTNAIKYTNDKGEIKAYIGFVNNQTYVKIQDNGIGIPKDSLDKIFERFYRVDKSRTRQLGGTGLGLSIAKEILDKNAGTIEIESDYGVGTKVIVRLPAKNTEESLNSDFDIMLI